MYLPNYGLTQFHIHHFMLYFVVFCGTGNSKLFFFFALFCFIANRVHVGFTNSGH